MLPRQADLAVARLRDRSRALPPAIFPPGREALGSWAKSLAKRIAALRAAKKRARSAAARVESAASVRSRALDAFNEDFARLAAWLEAMYRAAGLDFHADKVHPSGRRKGRLLAEVRRGSRRKTAVANRQRVSGPLETVPADGEVRGVKTKSAQK